MPDRRARYVGHPDGVNLSIPMGEGDFIHRYIPHGGELPAEDNGRKIPASYRDSLLAQSENWTEVKRATGDETKGSSTTTTKDGEK